MSVKYLRKPYQVCIIICTYYYLFFNSLRISFIVYLFLISLHKSFFSESISHANVRHYFLVFINALLIMNFNIFLNNIILVFQYAILVVYATKQPISPPHHEITLLSTIEAVSCINSSSAISFNSFS